MAKTLQIGEVTVPGQVLMAPMTGITDLPFRVLASKLGAVMDVAGAPRVGLLGRPRRNDDVG